MIGALSGKPSTMADGAFDCGSIVVAQTMAPTSAASERKAGGVGVGEGSTRRTSVEPGGSVAGGAGDAGAPIAVAATGVPAVLVSVSAGVEVGGPPGPQPAAVTNR